MALLLLGAACGTDGEGVAGATPAATDAPGEARESPADEPSETPTEPEAPTTTPEAPEEPESGDGVGRATVAIGQETWSFDQVALCTTTPQQDATVSFVMIIQQEDWQLVAIITDPTAGRRLEGADVFATIDFQFVPDPTQGIWLASGEATGEQFLVIDGLSVTASANFDDLRTTEVEETPGTLDVTCP